MSDVTLILSRIDRGDAAAASELLPLVYDELRKLAAQKMVLENPGQTLQATALVHEAYLRLVKGAPAQDWNSRGHFFAAAAEAMRRILVERARRYQAVKHGGQNQRVELTDDLAAFAARNEEVLAVDEALDSLAEIEPTVAELVKLHIFAQMPLEEAAQTLALSSRTAYRHWSFARAWLYRRLESAENS